MKISEMVSALNSKITKPVGNLKIFGQWFGRPYDDAFLISAAKDHGEFLELKTGENSCIRIWDPQRIEIEGTKLKIWGGSKVFHTWYSGSTYAKSYILSGTTVIVNSSSGNEEEFAWINEPAIEIL